MQGNCTFALTGIRFGLYFRRALKASPSYVRLKELVVFLGLKSNELRKVQCKNLPNSFISLKVF